MHFFLHILLLHLFSQIGLRSLDLEPRLISITIPRRKVGTPTEFTYQLLITSFQDDDCGELFAKCLKCQVMMFVTRMKKPIWEIILAERKHRQKLSIIFLLSNSQGVVKCLIERSMLLAGIRCNMKMTSF